MARESARELSPERLMTIQVQAQRWVAVRTALREQGRTATWLARRLGVSAARLCNYMIGRRATPPGVLEMASSELGVRMTTKAAPPPSMSALIAWGAYVPKRQRRQRTRTATAAKAQGAA